MNFEVKSIPAFLKKVKKLAKKYPSFKEDLATFIQSLENNPR